MPRKQLSPKFDRVPSTPHPKMQQFLMRSMMVEKPGVDFRYWNAGSPFLDQGSEGACVGFGWAHWLNAGPIVCRPKLTNLDALKIYNAAKTHDEWPGENYDGSSVNGGALALRDDYKAIGEFHWAFNLDDLVNGLLQLGPIVLGTNWYTGMMTPSMKGVIKATGDKEGGHCYIAVGANKKTRTIKLKNSWGQSWGRGGFATISFDDVAKLLLEEGEACIATELSSRFPR